MTSIKKNKMVFNFDEFESYIDDSVIKLVKILGCKKITSIKEAKHNIKNKLLINPKIYTDYGNNKELITSLLFQKVQSDNDDDFIIIFLSSTFLLESFIKINHEDLTLCNKVNNIIYDLYLKFKEEIKNHPDL